MHRSPRDLIWVRVWISNTAWVHSGVGVLMRQDTAAPAYLTLSSPTSMDVAACMREVIGALGPWLMHQAMMPFSGHRLGYQRTRTAGHCHQSLSPSPALVVVAPPLVHCRRCRHSTQAIGPLLASLGPVIGLRWVEGPHTAPAPIDTAPTPAGTTCRVGGKPRGQRRLSYARMRRAFSSRLVPNRRKRRAQSSS